MTMDETAREPVLVDLALQGSGSHGAFTWGVLDRLIEEPWLRIEAISGTSAGAMNAALVADGWTQAHADDIGQRSTTDLDARLAEC
jgi:NTE family protein